MAGDLHAVLQSMPGGVALLDYERGQILAVNSALEGLCGRPAAELAGLELCQLAPESVRQALQRHSNPDQPCGDSEEETELLRSDGSVVPVELICRVADVGATRRKIAYFRDITRQRQYDEALHISRFFMDKSGGIIFWIDRNARIVYANDGAVRHLGYSIAELMNMTIHDVDINFSSRLWSMMWEHFKTIRSNSLESVFRTKDGRIFPVEVSGSYVQYNNQEYNFVFAWDVSRRKQAEIALKESQQRLSAFIDSATESFYLYDADLRLVEINPAALRYLGVPKETVLGRHILELDPGLGIVEHHDEFREVLIRGGGMSYSDRRNDPRHGESYFDIKVFKVGDGLGVIAADVTEHKRMEQEIMRHHTKLEELVKIRTEALAHANFELKEQIEQRRFFTQALIHDLKTPLTPLLGASDMLVRGLTEEPWRQVAQSVHLGAVNLQRTVGELFDMEKGQMGLLELECAFIDVVHLLRETVEYERLEASANQQEFTADIPESLPRIWADAVRLRQIVMNLISNAFKYTPSGGSIRLEAKMDGENLTVRVYDNGLGIAREDQENIFIPYRRFSNSSREHLSGLGLGLALSKRLVELHGGNIWVESQPGKGSMFGFSIPGKIRNSDIKETES